VQTSKPEDKQGTNHETKQEMIDVSPAGARTFNKTVLIVGLIFVVVIGTLIYALSHIIGGATSQVLNHGGNQLDQSDMSDTLEEAFAFGLAKIDVIPGWNEEIFNSIQVAERSFESGSSTFSGGDLIQEVVRIHALSLPVRQIFYTIGEIDYVTAQWESPLWSDHSVNISITFEEATGVITHKDIFGFEMGMTNERFSHDEGLAHIDLVKGWNEEIFSSIQPAIANINSAQDLTWYSDGDFYQALLQKVGEPHSVHERTNGSFVAIWESASSNPYIEVWIDVDETSGMITRAHINGFTN